MQLLCCKKYFLLLLFCALTLPVFADVLLPPQYTVQKTKEGYIYYFTQSEQYDICYRIFDAFTGTIKKGKIGKRGTLAINHNDSVTAWKETAGGTQSREITLHKRTDDAEKQNECKIVSPVAGTWGNMQSLVVEKNDDTELYYSFFGTNPLEFGFAYDGPVLIEAEGEVALNLVALYADGSIETKTINYTVTPGNASNKKNILPLTVTSLTPLVHCGVKKSVNLPPQSLYSVDGGKTFLPATTLSLQYPSCVSQTVPLLVQYQGELYRYVLQTIDEPATDERLSKSLKSPIQVIDWNFIMFQQGSAVQYAIDNGEWKNYSEPFYLDRKTSHTIHWKSNNYADSLVLPEKPSLAGVPKNGITCNAVELSLSNSLYTFRIEEGSSFSRPLTSFYADIINGCTKDYVLNLPIYYGAIRQGEIPVRFTIDKEAPPAPVLTPSTDETFSRESVSVAINSAYNVYSAVEEVRLQYGFYEVPDEVATNIDVSNKNFAPFVAEKLLFAGDDNFAVTYTVYAYAQDKAGNKSEPVACRVTVDKNNYYLDAGYVAENCTVPSGTSDEPFSSITDAISAINAKQKAILHVRGIFNNVKSLQINSPCTIIGEEGSCFSFEPEAVLSVKKAEATIETIVMQKNNPKAEAVVYYGGDKNPLILLEDASLNVKNSTLMLQSPYGATAIVAKSSNVNLYNTNISVVAQSYVAALTAFTSNVSAQKAYLALSAENAVGFSVSGGTFFIEDTSCAINAKRSRGAELYQCSYTIARGKNAPYMLDANGKQSAFTFWRDESSIDCTETSLKR